MKDRIKQIRKENKLTQKEFAERLGIKQNTVASYEMGRIGISDSVIISICREFNISKDWLKNGTGEMNEYTDTDDYSEISTLIGEKDPKAKQAIIDYWKLSDSDKQLFWNFADKFLKRAGD